MISRRLFGAFLLREPGIQFNNHFRKPLLTGRGGMAGEIKTTGAAADEKNTETGQGVIDGFGNRSNNKVVKTNLSSAGGGSRTARFRQPSG